MEVQDFYCSICDRTALNLDCENDLNINQKTACRALISVCYDDILISYGESRNQGISQLIRRKILMNNTH